MSNEILVILVRSDGETKDVNCNGRMRPGKIKKAALQAAAAFSENIYTVKAYWDDEVLVYEQPGPSA